MQTTVVRRLPLGRRDAIRSRKRNRRIIAVSVMVALAAMVLTVVFVIQEDGEVPGDEYSYMIGQPASPQTMSQVTGVTDSTLSSIGVPSSVRAPESVDGQSLASGGKPEVLYIGGEFCPYCAVERWSLIIALSHFGNFSGLEYMQSSSTDYNPNTPTFTFANVTYVSPYITFVAVEEFNRAGQTAATLAHNESTPFSNYGTCPATGEAGGIPFIDIANQYVVNCGAQFSLPQIAGKNWTQVASQLNDPNSAVAHEIDGAANTLITAICNVDGGQSSTVCSQPFGSLTLDRNSGSYLQSHPSGEALAMAYRTRVDID
jgi:Domain of unknown function (DUF929)